MSRINPEVSDRAKALKGDLPQKWTWEKIIELGVETAYKMENKAKEDTDDRPSE